MLQKLRSNKEGFTLIELMIVIAIIGILAAIAIPNFIAYRNKAYCSAAESDAQATMAALADYYSIPSHNDVPAFADLGITASNANSIVVNGSNTNAITVVVTDTAQRCPTDYQDGDDRWTDYVYTIAMD